MDADEAKRARAEFALVRCTASRGFSALMRQASRSWRLALRPVRREFALSRRIDLVISVAHQRRLPIGIPPCSTGRPRRLDYAGLAVMLAAGYTHAEVGRQFGTSHSTRSVGRLAQCGAATRTAPGTARSPRTRPRPAARGGRRSHLPSHRGRGSAAVGPPSPSYPTPPSFRLPRETGLRASG